MTDPCPNAGVPCIPQLTTATRRKWPSVNMRAILLPAALLLGVVLVNAAAAFSPSLFAASTCACTSHRSPFSQSSSDRPTSQRCMYIGDGTDKDGSNQSDDENVMSSNYLSHAMIRVPSVNATVEYWVAKGARVTNYNKSDRGETVFVTLGNAKEDSDDGCFSLEISSLPGNEELNIGNSIVYFGTSMLLDCKNNLIGAVAGEKPKQGYDGDIVEPNGIEVQRVASGPGDYFARFCLRPKPVVAVVTNGEPGKSPLQLTEDFYTNVLGMRVVANDNDLLCLRYKNSADDGRFGVSTTLVFSTEGQEGEELVMGNILDHFVISTKNIDEAAEVLKGSSAIFMEPKRMFGTTIMGVEDPNGFKIYLAEDQ